MPVQRIIEEALVSRAQLAELPYEAGLCISVYLPLYSSQNDTVSFGTRLRAAIERARQEQNWQALARSEREGLLGQLHEFAQKAGRLRRNRSLAIFCAQDVIRVFRVPDAVRESVHVANVPYIRPLLPALTHRRDFYILALSQKHIRLLRCVDGEVKTVALPASLPTSVEQAGAFNAPDHDLEGRTAGGSSSDAMTRIHFGTNTAEEKSNAYIHDFFKIIDREINRLFGASQRPIVLAAVNREMAVYHKVSSYPKLLENGIAGSPERIADSELHRRALCVLNAQDAADEERLLLEVSDKQSQALALTDLPSVFMAAGRGQIQELLLSDKESGTAEDEMLNMIALETIRHDGKVSAVSAAKLPGGSRAAAILRYQEGGRSS